MNQKTLGVLVAAAVAASTAAFFATRSEPTASAEVKSGTKLFPGLIEHVNDVAKIEVRTKDGGFTVAKDGESWGLVDKGGYPVNLDKVKELVVTVAQMAIVEKKSARPENHAAMDVQDVDVKDSGATQVKLFDASGKEAAALLIGKARTTKGFGGQYAMFARKVGDPQAYEVTGRIWVDGAAANWLADNKQVLKLEKTRVHSVVTRHADGTVLDVHKNVPEDQAFAVADLPEGAELKWNGVADATAGALEYLTFEDVAPAGSVDLTGLTPIATQFTTWDGMVVDVELYEKGEGDAAKGYVAVKASFDETKRFKKVAPVGPPPPEANPTDPTWATPPADAAKPATDEFVGKAPDEVRKEVDALNAKLSKWIYTVPGYTAANFKKTIKDMLKDKSAPQEHDEGAHDDGLPPELLSPEEQTPELPPVESPTDDGGK
ncbi:MAG: DUF4340 domain-containing protein [Planctomycetes bacterium]|nr:DUF4340 domain-containing protein [Planctomycetota bacterium]